MPPAGAQLIRVTSPDYRSDVHGTTSIHVSAPGYRSPLEVKSWLPGGDYGSDSRVASVSLDAKGEGAFDLPADRYPHGPITVRITGTRVSDQQADTCYLQLYNTGESRGMRESQPRHRPALRECRSSSRTISAGLFPSQAPAMKRDMEPTNPTGSTQQIPFVDPTSDGPFFQRDSYLIIRANALRNTTGLISSVNSRMRLGSRSRRPITMERRLLRPMPLVFGPPGGP